MGTSIKNQEEKADRVALSIRIASYRNNMLKIAAKQLRMSKNSTIEKAIADFLYKISRRKRGI